MLYPVNRASAEVLDRIAAAPRLGDVNFEWTRGWEEDRDRKLGFFESRSAIPGQWDDVILHGPPPNGSHPSGKAAESNDAKASARLLDYRPRGDQRGLHSTHQLPGRSRPTSTSLRIRNGSAPSSDHFRLAWRAWPVLATCDASFSVIPAGTVSFLSLLSLTSSDPADLAVTAGFTGSVVETSMIKVTGVRAHQDVTLLAKFPMSATTASSASSSYAPYG